MPLSKHITLQPGDAVATLDPFVSRHYSGGRISDRYVVVQDRTTICGSHGRAGGREITRDVTLPGSVGLRGGIKPHDEWCLVVKVRDELTVRYHATDVVAVKRASLVVLDEAALLEDQRAAEVARADALRVAVVEARRHVRDAVICWVFAHVGVHRRTPAWGDNQIAQALVDGGVVPAPVVPSLREWQVLAHLWMASGRWNCGEESLTWSEELLTLDDVMLAEQAVKGADPVRLAGQGEQAA